MANTKGMHQDIQEKVAARLAFQHCQLSASNPPAYKEDVNQILTHYEAYMREIDAWYDRNKI